jgi:hypothetical protein
MYGNDGIRMVNDKLEGMWNEAARLYQYIKPSISMEDLRKIKKMSSMEQLRWSRG